MSNALGTVLDESINNVPVQPNIAPIYSKCLACPDYGTTCRGFDLVSLGDIGSVRAFHRAVKKTHGLSLKAIASAAPMISESTINEYFSQVEKDYKWTTVVAIDSALLSICGHRIGMPPPDHSCPAASSEYRNMLAAADLKLATADLNAANLKAECDDLRRRLADADGSHVAQLADIQALNRGEVEWLKNDVKFWRRIAFIFLGIGLIAFALLLCYFGYDIAHPNSGLIRY